MRKSLFYFFVAALFLQPTVTFAQFPPSFGGYVLFSMPCTCIPGTVLVQYAVLHPLIYPYVFRALLLTPATIRYNHIAFLILPPPTSWHLGKFTPAPLTPCLGVAPLCLPPFADGIILYTGSSSPGFPL